LEELLLDVDLLSARVDLYHAVSITCLLDNLIFPDLLLVLRAELGVLETVIHVVDHARDVVLHCVDDRRDDFLPCVEELVFFDRVEEVGGQADVSGVLDLCFHFWIVSEYILF